MQDRYRYKPDAVGLHSVFVFENAELADGRIREREGVSTQGELGVLLPTYRKSGKAQGQQLKVSDIAELCRLLPKAFLLSRRFQGT